MTAPRGQVSSPVSRQDHGWSTVETPRRVLVVVHNVTAVTRLLDILPLWCTDTRIQTVFSCPDSSAFTTGTADFLAELGIVDIPWEEALSTTFDLAVSASYGGPLHKVRAPLVVVPHGMGYNKFLEPETGNRKPETGNRKPVFGLSESWLMHGDEPVPSVAVLSHDEQLDRLRRYVPEAVDAALVAGDPCFDRLLTSRPLRETYRGTFGIRPEQRMIMISSTWGAASLFGRDPHLIARLARRLPLDEYRVVVALHPNIWHCHTPWQVRMWLDECARAGVLVLPAREGWRAALVAADVTLGDHGSVAFYSAALGTPLLLTTRATEALDTASPIAGLLDMAPRLDRHNDPLPQIESVIAAHSPERYAPVTTMTTSVPGESARILRHEVYARLGLDEPDVPADPRAVPIPEATPPAPESQLVAAELDGDHGGTVTATLSRYPAESLREVERLPSESILVTGTDEPRRRWLELAEVLLHTGPCPDPGHWIRTSLAALPGCLLGAVRCRNGDWIVGGVEGPLVRFTGPADLGHAYCGIVHAWLRTGRKLHELPELAHLRLGNRRVDAHVEVLDPPE